MWKFFVKNYSQYSGRFFFRHKILITFILFFSFSFFNFLGAEDYYFVNDSTITPSSGDATGAGDGKWSNAANWNTQMDGSGDVAAAAPGSADNVFFIKESDVELDADVTILSLKIPGTNGQNSSFSVTISGSHKLTITGNGGEGIETFRAPDADGAGTYGTTNLILECEVESPRIRMHSGGNITIGNGASALITILDNPGAGNTPDTFFKIENSGSLTNTNLSLFYVDFTNDGTFENTSSVAFNDAEIINNGSFEGSDISFTDAVFSNTDSLICGTLGFTNSLFTNDASGTVECTTATLASAASLKNDGTIKLTGDFDGTLVDDTGSGEFIFNGNSDQTFNPAGKTYSEIEVDNASGNFTFDGNIEATDITITQCSNLTFGGTSEITNLTVTDCADLTFSGAADIATIIITDCDDVLFSDNAELSDLSITACSSLTFDAVAEITDLNITACPSISFSGTTEITNFAAGTTNSTVFAGTTTIHSFTDSTASGVIEFQTGATIDSNFSHTADNTIIAGTFTAQNVELENAQINGTVIAASFEAEDISITGKIQTTGVQNLHGDVQLSGNTIFEAGNNKTITFEKTVDASSAVSGSANLTVNSSGGTSVAVFNDSVSSINSASVDNAVIKASFSCTTLTVNKSLLCSGNSSITAAGTASAPGILISNGDFVATGTASQNCIIDSTMNAKNCVIYGSNVQIKKNLSVTNDFLIYGSSYSAEDIQTGYNIFSYLECAAAFGNVTSANKTNYNAAKLPDGSNLPSLTGTALSGNITVSAGCEVSIGENFYANGVSVNAPATGDGSGKWKLKIKENKNTSANFAIACNCNFSSANCEVYGWNGTSGAGTAASSTYDNIRIVSENTTIPSAPYSYGFDGDELLIDTTTGNEPCTVADNVILIKFNNPIRNVNSQISNGCTNQYIKNSGSYYSAAYSNLFYATELAENAVNITEIYLKSVITWNTSATGSSTGNSGDTDKEGNSRTVKPTVELLRAASTAFNPSGTSTGKRSYCITDLWGKRIAHYSGTAGSGRKGIYDGTLDKCPPVLISVKTGQENHEEYNSSTGAASQHSYDAHNFIEFSYSEYVNFGSEDTSVCDVWLPCLDGAHGTTGSFQAVENIAVTDSFGALTGSVSSSGNLSFGGLGVTIASGQIHTGRNGSDNKYVNALYRTNERSLRISIAGYTDGTASYNGNTYKKWAGYIESAVTPSGTVSLPNSNSNPALSWTNSLVKDMQGNSQSANVKKTSITVDSNVNISSGAGAAAVYGPWDTAKPVFAQLNKITSWNSPDYSSEYDAEAVASTPGSGSILDRIGLHFFDNKPAYNSSDATEAYWRSGLGWCTQGTDSLFKTYSYAADIFGGSRAFSDSAANRTGGGLRVCSVVEAFSSGAFTYKVLGGSPDQKDFTTLTLGASTVFFTGTSGTNHPTDEKEGLYITMQITDTGLPVNTTFSVRYDSASAYLTDLAGNRMQTSQVRTLDRTPPSFDITLSPVAKNQINIIFVKKIVTNTSSIHYATNTTNTLNETTTQSFNAFLPACFQIITIDSSTGAATPATDPDDLMIDTSKAAEISHITSNSNGIGFSKVTLTTNREITLEDLQKYYVQVIRPAGYNQSKDPFTNILSNVTFIQDETGNYIQLNSAHAISDFAINAVTPQFAYPNSLDFGNESSLENPWTARDFGREQQNFGTLPLNESFDLISVLNDGSSNCSIFSSTDLNGDRNYGVRTYFCSSPDSDAVAKQINADLNLSLRVWLPQISGTDFSSSIFRGFSHTNIDANNNSTLSSQKANYLNSNQIIVSPSKEKVSEWSKKGEVQFMFSITKGDSASAEEVSFCSSPVLSSSGSPASPIYSVSDKRPLFAIRLENDSDILSLDLWSIKFKGIKNQRGGVTILNNVINPENDEECVVKINMPEEGNLNVIVMTADGNVIKYLSHGRVSEGEHYFTWDGKNKNGKSVARGIYFIRVNGSDIDENRKVMIVK